MDLDRLIANFEILPDWMDRYKLLIDLGRKLPEFPDEARIEEYKVRGCQSQVWLIASLSERTPATVDYRADSDAHIVKGLIAVLLMMYVNKNAQEVLDVQAENIFQTLGLDQHLSPSRSNGLFSMVKRIRELAQSYV